jgi:hypothetical protein
LQELPELPELCLNFFQFWHMIKFRWK